MGNIRHFLFFIILCGFAFVLQELPNSNVLQSTLPNWPLLLVIYFALTYRMGIAITLAFVIGATQDVFMGMPIGLNALAFTLSAFFVIRSHHQNKFSNALRQGFLVMTSVWFVVSVNLIYSSLLFSPAKYYWVLFSIPTSFIAWTLLHMFFSFLSYRWGSE